MQLNISLTVSGLPVSVFKVQAPTQDLSELGTDSRDCQTMASSDCDVKLKREKKGEIENIISLSMYISRVTNIKAKIILKMSN